MKKLSRIVAGVVAFVGINVLAAAFQAFLPDVQFWPSLWMDLAATLAFGVIVACGIYALGGFD
jgi:hypothetical protein